MGFKSIIFGVSVTVLCPLSINSAFAASVWSTELLSDGVSTDWRLHVVSDDADLFNPAHVTGVYIDSVLTGQIDPIDLLTNTPAVIASGDSYDFASNSMVNSEVEPSGADNIVIVNLSTTGLQGVGIQQDLTCALYFECTVWLNHPLGGTRQVLSVPDSTLVLTRSALSSVPVPAAVWLFSSGLIGLIGFA